MLDGENSWIVLDQDGEVSFIDMEGLQADGPKVDVAESQAGGASGYEAALESQGGEASWYQAAIDLLKDSRRLLIGVAFLAGLILGWIVIGRWLWPANRNAEPWDLRQQHQANYITLVAEDYWHTKDVMRARDSLAGWDEEELTDLIADMAARTSSLEERQRLVALARALQLPYYQLPTVGSFLLDRGILLSFVLSASPLIVAIVMAVSPLVGRSDRKTLPKGVDELLPSEGPESLEEMLRQDGMGPDGEYGEGDAHATEQDETEGYVEGSGEPGEEDLEDFDEDWDEWDDDDMEMEGIVADILLELFEDDEESFAHLEALATGLPEVNIEDVMHLAHNIMLRFQTQERRVA